MLDFDEALQLASKIKLLILDVDGVLTDGHIYLGQQQELYKSFHIQDGLGIKLLLKAGIEIAIITGRSSDIVKLRMQELGVKYVFQAQSDKLIAYDDLLKSLRLHDHNVCYIGDDLHDLPCIMRAGLGVCVANSYEFVQENSNFITKRPGGFGAVREVCDLLLQAQGKLDKIRGEFITDV